MQDFWKPKYKWQLMKALTYIWPKDGAKFKVMGKAQLYAIYFKEVRNDQKRKGEGTSFDNRIIA